MKCTKKMKRKSQIKGLIPRRIYRNGSLDCPTIQMEKQNIIPRAVSWWTKKTVIINAINSIIFALASTW
jgi:hypothetical protein